MTTFPNLPRGEQVCGTEFASSCLGICNITTNECMCPPGWRPNVMSWFRDDCSEPVGLFEVTFGLGAFYCVVAIVLVLRRLGSLHRTTRTLVLYFTLAQFFLLMANIAALVVGYVSIVFWILAGPILLGAAAIAYGKMLLGFFDVSAKSVGSTLRHERFVRYAIILSGVIMVIPTGAFVCLGMIVLGWETGTGYRDTYDVKTHNELLFWGYLTFPLHTFILAPLGLWVSSDLLQKITQAERSLRSQHPSSAAQQYSLASVKMRLRMFRLWNVFVFVPFEWIFTGGCYVALADRRSTVLPYFSAAVILGTPFILLMQIVLLTTKAKHDTSSTTPVRSNNNNEKSQNDENEPVTVMENNHLVTKARHTNKTIAKVNESRLEVRDVDAFMWRFTSAAPYLHKYYQSLQEYPRRIKYFLYVWGGVGNATIMLVLLGACPLEVAWVFLILWPFQAIAPLVSFLSMPITVNVLLRSPEVLQSLVIELLFTLTFCDVLKWDLRCIFPWGMLSSYFLVACADAMVFSVTNIKHVVCGIVAVTHWCIWICMTFGLLYDVHESKFTVNWGNGQSNTFSVSQYARDLCLISTLVITRQFLHMVRGRSLYRFFSISEPIRVVFRSMNYNNNAGSTIVVQGGDGRGVGASQIVVHSDFLVDEDGNNKASSRVGGDDNGNVNNTSAVQDGVGHVIPTPAAPKFVDKVYVKESDALAVHFFGQELGTEILHVLRLRSVRLMRLTALFTATALITLMCFPNVYDIRLSYIVLVHIPLELFSALGFSKSMLRLIFARNSFKVDLGLLLVFGVTMSVFLGDARACVVLTSTLITAMLLCGDALIRISHVRRKTTLGRGIGILFAYCAGFCILPALLFLRVIPFSTVFVNFRAGTLPDDVDAMYVFDIANVVTDVGLALYFKCALQLAFSRISNAAGYLFSVRKPVIPVFYSANSIAGTMMRPPPGSLTGGEIEVQGDGGIILVIPSNKSSSSGMRKEASAAFTSFRSMAASPKRAGLIRKQNSTRNMDNNNNSSIINGDEDGVVVKSSSSLALDRLALPSSSALRDSQHPLPPSPLPVEQPKKPLIVIGLSFRFDDDDE